MASVNPEFIECPACEAMFKHPAPQANAAGDTQCPHCQFSFTPDRRPTTESIEKPRRKLQIPKPRCLSEDTTQYSDSPKSPPPITPPPKQLTANGPADDGDSTQVDKKTSRSNKLKNGSSDSENSSTEESVTKKSEDEYHVHAPVGSLQLLHAQRKSSRSKKVLVVALLLLCILLLGGIAYLLTRETSQEHANNDPTSNGETKETNPPSNPEEVDGSTDDENANEDENDNKKAPGIVPDDKGEALIKSTIHKRIYDRIWEKNSKHIVQLKLSGSENSAISGMVIDRRGWILTALNLYQSKLESIEQITRTSWKDQPPSFRKLSAVESLPLVLPGFGLCVVKTAASDVPKLEIELDDKFDFSESTVLYAINASAASSQDQFIHCKTEKRATINEEEQQALAAAGIKPDPLFRWIKHSGKFNRVNSPCPLFSETGECVAIHLHYEEATKTGYAIPTVLIPHLRMRSIGDPKQYADSKAVQDLLKQFGPTKKEEVQSLADISSNLIAAGDLSLIDQLRTQFIKCDAELDWLPRSLDEYQQIQPFVNLLIAAEQIGRDEKLSDRRRSFFTEEVDRFCDRLKTIHWPSGQEIDRQNQFATRVLKEKGGQPFFAYVTVEVPSAISPTINKKSTTILRVTGTDQRIIIPISEHGLLDPKTNWLILGRDQGKEVSYTSGDLTKKARLIFAYRLIANPEK